jgi:hypothetical protein
MRVCWPGGGWPFLVVMLRYGSAGGSWSCGAGLLPEQRRLFLGGGKRLVAYDLAPAALRPPWTDTAGSGFAERQVHGDVVIMWTEIEPAARDALLTAPSTTGIA